MAGVKLPQALAELGLIDEYEFVVHQDSGPRTDVVRRPVTRFLRRGRLTCRSVDANWQTYCDCGKLRSMDLIDRILALIVPGGIAVPDTSYTLIRAGRTRQGERAVAYRIPNRKNRRKPYTKLIPKSLLDAALAQLQQTGHFERSWFASAFRRLAKSGPCTFKATGGSLKLLGLAHFDPPATYRRQ